MSTSAPIPIIQSNLVFCLDAGNTKSYPGSGTTWYNVISPGIRQNYYTTGSRYGAF